MRFRPPGLGAIVRFGGKPDEPVSEEHWAAFRRRILVVCYGNACRSPVAAGLLRARLPADTWQVLSAGTEAVLGQPATRTTSGVAAELGVELSLHRSQPLDETLVRACGLILTMSRRQAHAVIDLEPAAAARVRLLGAFAPADNIWKLPADYRGRPARRDEIADPADQSSDLHRECFARLERAVGEVAGWLLRGGLAEEAPATADSWPAHGHRSSSADDCLDL